MAKTISCAQALSCTGTPQVQRCARPLRLHRWRRQLWTFLRAYLTVLVAVSSCYDDMARASVNFLIAIGLLAFGDSAIDVFLAVLAKFSTLCCSG